MNMEFNKIFAAILCAGIVASFSGFLANKFVSPSEVTAHGPEATGSAAAQAQPAGPEPILSLIAGADPARGQKIFRACASCHTVEKGAPNGIGPNLWNILDRGTEAVSGFGYSGAIHEAAGESWEYAELNKFLWKPKKFAAGTAMNYIGLKKPEDRAAMIAYMRTLADSPAALPSAEEIAAEEAELAPPPAEAEETHDEPAQEQTNEEHAPAH